MTRAYWRRRFVFSFESLESRLAMAALQVALNDIGAGESNCDGLQSGGELARVRGEESPNLESGSHSVDHDVSGSGTHDPVAPSQPRFLWTAEWQANWERARAENHPWWQLIKSSADRTGTAGEQYNDYGQWCALVYQITGDNAYGQKALDKLLPVVKPLDGNQVREYYVEYVILYDWLLPAMSVEQKAAYEAGLIKLAEYSMGINTPAYEGGFLLGDSDQTVGQYFGLALTDLALGTDYLTRTAKPIGGYVVEIGGLDATTDGKVTARNTIKEFFAKSAGGQWLESSEYNLGTNKLVLMGVAAIRTATGQEHFPEAVEYFAALKQSMLSELTPDLKDSFQWGDLEHPHGLDMFHRGAMMVALGLHGVLDEMTYLQPRGFYFTTPYDPKVTPPAKIVHQAPGIGAVVAKDETKFFASHMANRLGVHHDVNYLNTFQLWANGEWVIDHPRGYNANYGNTVNGMLLAGLSSMSQRGLVTTGQGDGYVYQIGTTGGVSYPQPYHYPPAEFLHAWTRTVVYLPEYTAIVVYDSIDMDDPEALPGFDHYAAADQAAIQNAPALKQWFLHTPVQAAIQGNKASWQTNGGQNVTLRTLLGGTYTTTAVNEQTDPAFASGFEPSELKWHVRLASNDATAFLNVISVGPEVASNLLAANKLQIGNHTIEFQGQQVQIVSGNIPGENRFPTAQADSVTTQAGTAITINVLANDSDPDGDSLSVAGFTQPAHGTVTQVSGGLRYAPASGYAGADSFTYTITDGREGTAMATVSVAVQPPPNTAPTAQGDSVTTAAETTATINVLANDSDPDGDLLSVAAFTQPAHGTVSQVSGGLRYAPASGYAGADSFTYTIADGREGTAMATVAVTVQPPPNTAPTAQGDSVTTAAETATTINVLANDSDPDGDSLSVAGFTQPAHGTVTQVSGGLRYTPGSDYVGTDSFTYTIADGREGTAMATVAATVKSTEPPNNTPTLTATPGDDTIYLRPSSDGSVLYAYIGDPNGEPVRTWPMDAPQRLMIDTLAGNDQLIVQLGDGVSGPAGGIQLEAGAGDNTLRIESGSILVNALSTGGALNTTVGGGAQLSTARLNQAGLTMSGSGTKVTIQPHGTQASVLSTLSMDANSIFDITDNNLILRAAAETNDAIHADVVAKILSAQNGLDPNLITNWNGPGITSSVSRSHSVTAGFNLFGLGVIRNSDLEIATGLPGATYTSFGGVPLSANDVLLRTTYLGDANLDGTVNFDDYARADSALFGLIPNLGWAAGDVNLDDTISFDDFIAMDQAYFAERGRLIASASIEANPDSLYAASSVNPKGFLKEFGIASNDLTVVKLSETQRSAPETSSERSLIAISSMPREEINSVADERLSVKSRDRTRELHDAALFDFGEEV